MQMSVIDALRNWFTKHKDRLAISGIAMAYTEGAGGEESSARIDFDSEMVIGRATIWATGLCDLELLSVETGEQVLYQHHQEVSGTRLPALLDDLARRMTSSM